MPYDDIRYDGDTAYTSRVIIGNPATPKMFLFLQKWSGGTVRDTRHAAYASMAIAGVFLAAAAIIFLSLVFGRRSMTLRPAEKSFNNFLSFLPVIPRDPVNRIGNDDTPWWFALTYTYGVPVDGQQYDLLTNLENTGDMDRCELRLWRSHAVWPTDTGCYATATLGNVPDRSKQIYAPK